MNIIVIFDKNKVQVWDDYGLLEEHEYEEKNIKDVYYTVVGSIGDALTQMKEAEKRRDL